MAHFGPPPLEHLECGQSPHIQGRGAKKHTQRARHTASVTPSGAPTARPPRPGSARCRTRLASAYLGESRPRPAEISRDHNAGVQHVAMHAPERRRARGGGDGPPADPGDQLQLRRAARRRSEVLASIPYPHGTRAHPLPTRYPNPCEVLARARRSGRGGGPPAGRRQPRLHARGEQLDAGPVPRQVARGTGTR